jgi:hypothetical protein
MTYFIGQRHRLYQCIDALGFVRRAATNRTEEHDEEEEKKPFAINCSVTAAVTFFLSARTSTCFNVCQFFYLGEFCSYITLYCLVVDN